jgi:methionyl-tRNA formyltransferase
MANLFSPNNLPNPWQSYSLSFSVGVLTALIDAGHNIVGVYCQPDRPKNTSFSIRASNFCNCVYCQPDRPKGRGRILTVCAVKEQALKHNLSVFQPESLKDDNAQKTLFALNADVMVVVAYGQLLPKLVLDTPKYGCLNIHASLLPRWRGAAPIQRAILAGDKTTGVCIMQMDEGLDTGNILLEKTCDITTTDTAQTLHDKLATLGAKAIIEALENFDNLSSTKQNHHNISIECK